jgi:hypothetical protein
MNLTSKISELQNRYSNKFDLGGLCFQYSQQIIDHTDIEPIIDSFKGSIEKSAAYGYLGIKPAENKYDELYSQLISPIIKKSVSIFHVIGISLLFKNQNDYRYQSLINERFENQSTRVKYLISKIFTEYQDQFNSHLLIENKENVEIKLLKNSLLKHNYKNLEFPKTYELDDIIHLLILIEFKNKKITQYEEDKKELLESILFASREIQSKHKVFNNNEDQYNSVLHSMLSMKFVVENQSQRGVSSSSKTFGELDLKVFTKENKYPLSIIEAFVISTIDKAYISKHLNKLTVNYDPNGLSRNFAVIYVNHTEFNTIWERYLKYIGEFEYSTDLKEKRIIDSTANFPMFSNIKIALGTFLYNNMPIEVYHLFLNMRKTPPNIKRVTRNA